MKLPKPEPGLVIRYSYLWQREHLAGREDGVKDRPCAIVLAVKDGGDARVLVVPITHNRPGAGISAMELPAAVKKQLGLDGERSWIVYSESNFFRWPGPDLRPVNNQPGAPMTYGFLPPRIFTELRRRFLNQEAAARVQRSE